MADLASVQARWPLFVDAASGLGYHSASTLPMRLRDRTIGGLDLFGIGGPSLSIENQRMAQALADATTVALLQQHSIEQASLFAEQLEEALSSRILIEQAKGILAERGRLSMDAAFASLRAYARNNNHQLSFVAELVVGGQAPLDDVLATNREERLPRSGD
ncbi:MAG: ANTAR domain-containing protein [Nocardioidaceae bacterium]